MSETLAPPAPTSLLSGQEQATNKIPTPATQLRPMLKAILNHELVLCAQSGDANQIQNFFPGFTEVILDLCASNALYSEKHRTFITLEYTLTMLAHDYEDMCKSCQKKIMCAVDYVRQVRTEILEKVAREEDPNAPPQPVRTHLKWKGSRVALCEKIYGEYVINYTVMHNGKPATLGCIIDVHNEIYGMDITVDECNDALQKIKRRKGKGYPDFTSKIPVRGFLIYDTHKAFEKYIIAQDGGDGRKQSRPIPTEFH